MKNAAQETAPTSQPEARGCWIRLAAATLDLAMSLDRAYVEKEHRDASALLSVYERRGANAERFILVEYAAELKPENDIRQLTPRYGVPMYLTVVTPAAELQVPADLLAQYPAIETTARQSKLKLVPC